ncbi:hypothetical protein OBV_44680 [Oscillibacter valericigenes Sjm18-20]|nr:hypothetical protein OBV_44680 [Oscillibacter valericigenes Sjm18-20]
MHEIKSSSRNVEGKEVQTWIAEFLNANVLQVEVGTTGYCGGDFGHGGRTFFKIKDKGGTALFVNGKEVEEVEIALGGDAELSTFIQSLEFALKVLKEQSEEK